MTSKSHITLISMLVSLIVLTLLLTADDSFAQRRNRRYTAPRHTHHETVIVNHRGRHARNWVANRKFFRNRRAHFRPYRGHYYGRRARFFYGRPYYRGFWPRNRAFISLSGVFYQGLPDRYLVVESPPETIVIKETPAVVTPVEGATGNVRATVSTLNIRTGPDLGYPLVDQVEEGAILELHGKTDGWLYVKLPDGHFGWAKSVFTAPLEPGNG